MMRIWIAVLITCSCICTVASACMIPPTTLFGKPADLVKATPTIVLAEAIKKSPSERNVRLSEFTFETVKSLKGAAPKQFSLRGYDANYEFAYSDFDAHSSSEFLNGMAFNASLPGDCNAYGHFKAGDRYLLFLDGPSYVRGFEHIKTEQDRWYQTIKSLINKRAGK